MRKSQKVVDIQGEIFGVSIKQIDDTRIMTAFIEDDGLWFETNLKLDVEWIDDMISVLQKVKSKFE